MVITHTLDTMAPVEPPNSTAATRFSVLHVSSSDAVGGSGYAAYRLHRGLQRSGWTSRMLVGRTLRRDADVTTVSAGRPMWLADRAWGRIADWLGYPEVYVPSSVGLSRHPWVRQADVVQVYNVHGGYLSLPALRAVARVRPVVWRLSDMWAATGHCGYSYDCERWRSGCGACPLLSEPPALRRDTTAALWAFKRRVYRGMSVTLVTPSQWLADIARTSPLLAGWPVRVIPTGVDTDVFHPMPQSAARARLGLPIDGRVILCGAAEAAAPRKGVEAFRRAMEVGQGERMPWTVAIVGAGRREPDTVAYAGVRWLGALTEESQMAAAYAAADVFVLPTRADNLPNMLLESLACGTPVVTGAVGGCPEAIQHGETGYLAPAGDVHALVQGIRFILEDAARRQAMSRQCRAVAERDYTLARQVRDFAALYREVIAMAPGLRHAD